MKCILDTSVVIKWFSDSGETDLDNALELRQSILDGTSDLSVPELSLYELSNALRYNPNFSEDDVKDAITSFSDMNIEIKRIDIETMKQAISMAFEFDVTVYDAYFLAMASMENRSLITADYKLVKRIGGHKNIIRLSDL